jgi:hypothetical protein
MTSSCPVVPAEANTGIEHLPSVPAPSKRFLVLYAVVTDDPDAPFDPAAPHEMFIKTKTNPPLELDGRYVIDKDCRVLVATECLRRGILHKLYPRESTA